MNLSTVHLAWYQREIELPKQWTGRRIVVEAQYVNTSAVVYLDGKRAGEIKSRGGKVDVTAQCQPGRKQLLSILVNWPRGGADFRGLCGDVYLEGMPSGERIDDVKIDTSVRQWQNRRRHGRLGARSRQAIHAPRRACSTTARS